jgi:hypothetical protein
MNVPAGISTLIPTATPRSLRIDSSARLMCALVQDNLVPFFGTDDADKVGGSSPGNLHKEREVKLEIWLCGSWIQLKAWIDNGGFVMNLDESGPHIRCGPREPEQYYNNTLHDASVTAVGRISIHPAESYQDTCSRAPEANMGGPQCYCVQFRRRLSMPEESRQRQGRSRNNST